MPNTVERVNNTSSCGYDNISNREIRYIKELFSILLTIIVNQSLWTGIFPDKLKIVEIKPQFRKDDNRVFNNYRPISLLHVISNIFEEIIHKQLLRYKTYNCQNETSI